MSSSSTNTHVQASTFTHAKICNHIMKNLLMLENDQIELYEKKGMSTLQDLFHYGPKFLLQTREGFDHNFPNEELELDNYSLKLFIMNSYLHGFQNDTKVHKIMQQKCWTFCFMDTIKLEHNYFMLMMT